MALEDIFAQANEFIKQQQLLGKNLIDISKEESELAKTNATLYQNIGAAKVISQKAQDTAAINLQSAKTQAGEIYHTDLSKFSAEIAANAEVVRNARTDQAAALMEIKNKQSVGITDNPAQWLINQFTINDDIRKHNAADKIADQATARIREANLTSRELAITQEQFMMPITAAAAAANVEAIKSMATIQANDAWTKALQYNATGVQAALNTSKEILATQFQVQSAVNQEKHIQIAQEHLDLSRQVAAEKKAKDLMEDSLLLQAVNSGIKLQQGESAPEFIGKDITLIKASLNSKNPNQFKSAFDTGLDFLTSGIKRLSTSPGDLFAQLQSGVRMNLPSTLDPLKKLIGAAAETVLSPAYLAQKGINPKDGDRIKQEISSVSNAMLAKASNEITPGTKNPFEILSLPQLISSSTTVANLPVVQKVLAPQIQTGAEFDTPEKVFSAVIQGVKDKKISYNEALELSTVYQAGTKANLEARQFTVLGFTPPGDGSWFSFKSRVQINPTSLFGKSKVIDFTKPAEIGAALNSVLANQAAAESRIGNLYELGYGTGQ